MQAVPLEVNPTLHTNGQEVALSPTPVYVAFEGASVHCEHTVEPAVENCPTLHGEQKLFSAE
jgi:hypothetical protein